MRLFSSGFSLSHAAEIGGDDARREIPGIMMRVRRDEIITIRRPSLMSGRRCVRENTLHGVNDLDAIQRVLGRLIERGCPSVACAKRPTE